MCVHFSCLVKKVRINQLPSLRRIQAASSEASSLMGKRAQPLFSAKPQKQNTQQLANNEPRSLILISSLTHPTSFPNRFSFILVSTKAPIWLGAYFSPAASSGQSFLALEGYAVGASRKYLLGTRVFVVLKETERKTHHFGGSPKKRNTLRDRWLRIPEIAARK